MDGATRFELISELGAGGMGVVYEAHDRQRNMRVALKKLRRHDASSLYRFKREFRALSDLSHPNIVALYELVAEDDDWFLSMELIEGDDFIAHVRKDARRSARVDTSSMPVELEPTGQRTMDTRVVMRPPRQRSETNQLPALAELPDEPVDLDDVVDLERLYGSLAQLAQALHALHAQGIIHRDLKPSNIRVTPEGRVVLMDFGIIAELFESAEGGTEAPMGTPSYMAPEQIEGKPPSAAADWYAFGVIAYEALSARLPFRGPSDQIIMAKLKRDPMPPGVFTRGIPCFLEELCMQLLDRDPVRRPPGYEVLKRLGVGPESLSRIATEVTLIGPSDFVGRSAELEELCQAYRQARAGTAVCVFARGGSGMGKTTLLRRFIYDLEVAESGHGMPLVLSGRCHERESLSYKAFDGVIDQLSRQLLELPEAVVEPLLPADVDLVTRLFPVLRRIPGVQAARPLSGKSSLDLRERAEEALRELIDNLGATRPLVIRIEDLQWADTDSLDLLLALLKPPAPRRLLILASLRTDISAPSASPASGEQAAVARLHDVLAALARAVPCHEVEVGPLSPMEQKLLVAKLIGERNVPADIDSDFWAEAEGNPLLLTELARFAAEVPGVVGSGPIQLENVISRRIALLPASAQSLLEVIAVSGEATPLSVLGEAVALCDEDRERASAGLRAAKLARVAVPGFDPWLSAQHDKIRETVLARLPAPSQRALHRRLALVLERWDGAAVPSLAHHWLSAGDQAQAATYLVSAARAAAEKLAFDRAAELYRVVLELQAAAPLAERISTIRLLGDALTAAGRYYEAAQVYGAAAGKCRDGDRDTSAIAIDLDQRSADCLLRSGRIAEGMERLATVMRHLGLHLATSRGRAVVGLLVQRAKLAVRGTRYTPRKENQLSARELGRIDTLYAAATALGMVDHLQGAVVQARHLALAFQVGEERRVCRALAIEVAYLAVLGGRHARRAEELADEVSLRARRLDDPYLIALAHLGAGMSAFFSGRMSVAAQAFADSVGTLDGVVGTHWEHTTAQYFQALALINTGAWTDLQRVVGRTIERAERHHDLYATNLFKAGPNVWLQLFADRVDLAHQSLDSALSGWPSEPFYIAHYQASLGRVIAHLYAGEGAYAAELIDQTLRPNLGAVMVNHIPRMMGELWAFRGRAMLACGDRAEARKMARRLTKLELSTSRALAGLIEAPIALHEGNQREAERLVSAALACFTACGESHMIAACQHRLGELLGGKQGDELIAGAAAWMSAHGVKNPTRMLALLTW